MAAGERLARNLLWINFNPACHRKGAGFQEATLEMPAPLPTEERSSKGEFCRHREELSTTPTCVQAIQRTSSIDSQEGEGMTAEYKFVESTDLGNLAAQLTQYAEDDFKPIMMEAVFEPPSEFAKMASRKESGAIHLIVLLEKK